MDKLLVTSSPHLRDGDTTQGIMLDVIIAMLPCLIASCFFFGMRSLMLTAVCVVSCVAAEYITRKIMKRDNTVADLSAVVTGMLLAFNLPVTLNPLFAVIGSVVAIVVAKQFFGGLGQNFVNPALVARIVLMVSFPQPMTTFVQPFWYRAGADAVSTATPLSILSNGGDVSTIPPYIDLLVGNRAGCLGETCALAIIFGGIYLVIRRVITPTIPVIYVGTVALGAVILGNDVAVQVLSGGLLLGAVFMATDYVTSPVTKWGRVIFAFGCGVLTVLIRQFGSLAEGVSYAILIMNILTPHIENLTRPRPFGEERDKK
ncbi:MAG: RnfABCDGE type electron transport complex subunit D [Clostridia bacterium]|nr:RnfABCDGE type electron transport complex subunit D [Clostridia bacterium]